MIFIFKTEFLTHYLYGDSKIVKVKGFPDYKFKVSIVEVLMDIDIEFKKVEFE